MGGKKSNSRVGGSPAHLSRVHQGSHLYHVACECGDGEKVPRQMANVRGLH